MYLIDVIDLMHKEFVMKKMVLFIVVCSYGGFLDGMELSIKRQEFKFKDTPLIELIHANLYTRPLLERAAITVAGNSEQHILGYYSLKGNALGDLFSCSKVYVKNEMLEKRFDYSGSLCFGPSIIVDGEKVQMDHVSRHTKKIKWPEILISVVEPIMFYSGPDKCSYNAKRRLSKNSFTAPSYSGKEALEQVENDLKFCYENVLGHAYRLFIFDHLETIAFPPLSRLEGVPSDIVAKAAVISVLNSKHKNKYSKIQFVIDQESDYLEYFKVLTQYSIELNDSMIEDSKKIDV